jgi:hypothetical protein
MRMTDDDDRSSAPADPEEEGAESARFLRIGLIFYGVMLAAALLWRMGLHGESILYATPEDALRGVSLGRDLVLGVVCGLAVVAVSYVFTVATGWGDALARGLAGAIGFIAVPDALLLALASGMGEEAFFRGALQPRVGIVWASLLFGCVHFIPRREFLPWTAFAILAGALFGALFLWTGNLIAPVTAHVVVNGINLPLLARLYGDTEDEGRSPGAGG